MDAYLPSSPEVAVVVLLAALAPLLLGARAASKTEPAAWPSWLLGSVMVGLLHLRTIDEPAGWRLLALVAVTFTAMKGIVVASAAVPLTAGRWWPFSALWVGMDPRPFAANARRRTRIDSRADERLRRGFISIAVGALLFLLARNLASGSAGSLPALALVFIGASLIVHFGAFAILAGLWQRGGVAVLEPFDAPHRATSLGEFWSRRWNRPFSEMTRFSVYAPVARAWGRPPALVASFAFSGLLHELAISVPVRAGYGLPTLYFLLHACAVLLEEQLARRGWKPRGMLGRAWCCAWLLLPLPLLFHGPFRAGVIEPLLSTG